MRALRLFALSALCAVASFAYPYQVTVDTSVLAGSDFQIYLALNSTTGNIVNVSNFSFFGGDAIQPPLGGPGNLDSQVNLDTTNTLGLVDFAQNFTAGSLLRFNFNLVTNNGPVFPNAPDSFSFALAEITNVNFPTTDPSGSDYLFTVGITGSSPTIQIFQTLGASIPVSIIATPEPSYTAASAGLLLLVAFRRRFRKS